MTTTGRPEVVCAILPQRATEAAAHLAVRLADRLGARLALVDVRVPIAQPTATPVAGPQPMMPVNVPGADGAYDTPTETRTDLAELAGRIGAGDGVRLDAVVAPPHDALQELAQAADTELLVAADDGGGPIASRFAGNSGRGVSRDATCPLVLVPRGARAILNDPPLVVCGIDDSDMTATVAGIARQLAGRLDGRVRFLHVIGDADAPAHVPEAELDFERRRVLDRLRALCREPGEDQPPDLLCMVGDASDALTLAATEYGADLLVIGRPAHGALGSALLGSVAHGVLAAGTTPVVIVPDAIHLASHGQGRPTAVL